MSLHIQFPASSAQSFAPSHYTALMVDRVHLPFPSKYIFSHPRPSPLHYSHLFPTVHVHSSPFIHSFHSASLMAVVQCVYSSSPADYYSPCLAPCHTHLIVQSRSWFLASYRSPVIYFTAHLPLHPFYHSAPSNSIHSGETWAKETAENCTIE